MFELVFLGYPLPMGGHGVPSHVNRSVPVAPHVNRRYPEPAHVNRSCPMSLMLITVVGHHVCHFGRIRNLPEIAA